MPQAPRTPRTGPEEARDLDEVGTPRPDGYPPIGYHGIIGDMHTACLIGQDASVDWYCYPHFDDSPIFCSLLDNQRGGRFSIETASQQSLRQQYHPNTNVLITRLGGQDGVLEVTDFMPVEASVVDEEAAHWHGLVRRVRALQGDVQTLMRCTPTFDYGAQAPKVSLDDRGALFEGEEHNLSLISPVDLDRVEGKPGQAGVQASFPVHAGQPLWFVLCDRDQGGPFGHDPTDPEALEQVLDGTLDYWRAWADQCTYTGRWQEHVLRSALTLKLLTFAPTGAIVAAPTTSLPENVGGERNWDYRFTWIRDASITLQALFRLGFVEEGQAFLGWLTDRIREADDEDEPIQVMYGIDGRRSLTERTIDHLEGYEGSAPVRVGNGAHAHRQLDIVGELLLAISQHHADEEGVMEGIWESVVTVLDWLIDHWRKPDEGVWEVRSGRDHFVYSKVMCWVAFDRAIRLAEAFDLPGDLERWEAEREAIWSDVLDRGIDPDRGVFVQRYGGKALDAANLRAPLFGFLPPWDPRVRATLEAIEDELVVDSLVYRYRQEETEDGLEGGEGSFSLCTFWWVDNLILQGDINRARAAFETMLTYSNHLDLFSEEIGLAGQALGNFPQAFTHVGLINTALHLDWASTEAEASSGPP